MQCCAYIGIHTESAHELPVLEKVRLIEGVEEAFRVYGFYDVIAKLNTASEESLKSATGKINGINSVRGASTLILVTKE